MSVLGYAVIRTDENTFTWWGQDQHTDEDGVTDPPGFTTKEWALGGIRQARTANANNSDLFKLVEIREVEV